ncbi:MAG: hypothetical protein AAFY21_01220 [Cyanobacteria bacterium J06641_2]
MPTKRPRISVQLESEELKAACEKFIEDEGIKSISSLVNELLIKHMVKNKYYKPAQPPKFLKDD